MVAACVEPPVAPLPKPRLELVPPPGRGSKDPRSAPRRDVALACWAMKPSRAFRGYVLDLSETGARLGGIPQGFALGQGLLLKIQLDPAEAPVILRAEARRWHDPGGGGPPQLAVHFLEVPFDEWFRLGRHLDRSSPTR